MIHGKAKGQVEVAVIKSAVPSHAELMAAHQPLHRMGIKRFPEKLHVILFSLFPDQFCPKSSQGHIGDREEVGKRNVKTLTQLAAVILFKGRLGRRKKRSSRIIDKIQWQLRVRSIAQGIQSLDGGDASFIDSLPPLSAYVLFQVTRQGRHELNLVVPEELGQLLHPRFQENRQVRPDLDLMPFSPKSRYKIAEMGIELRGSAGQIDQLTPGTLSRLQDQLHDRPFHDFISFGRGFKVAVRTLLVAQEPKIHL
jgi:hypothetical protein